MANQPYIEAAWEDRSLLEQDTYKQAVLDTLEDLDKGRVRTAEPVADGWQVNEWVKKAVILYFPLTTMQTLETGIFEWCRMPWPAMGLSWGAVWS